MHHDFHRSPSDVRRDKSGKACYGYMDYKQDTNYWSTCSVEFLTGQNKSCLKKIGGGTTQDPVTTRPGKLSCYFIDYLLTSLLYLVSQTITKHFKTFYLVQVPNLARMTKIMETIARNSRGLVRIVAIRGSAIHARARVKTAEVKNKMYLERLYLVLYAQDMMKNCIRCTFIFFQVSIHDWTSNFVVSNRYTFAVDVF